jgi:hypothetical protein
VISPVLVPGVDPMWVYAVVLAGAAVRLLISRGDLGYHPASVTSVDVVGVVVPDSSPSPGR